LVLALELVAALVSAAVTRGFSQDTIFKGSGTVEYIPGNINLLISVPHDGTIKLKEIPDRRNGLKVDGKCKYGKDIDKKVSSTTQCKEKYKRLCCKAVVVRDLNASTIAETAVQEYVRLSGGKERPHVLYARLHRTKVDFNRGVDLAAQGNELAVKIYNDYHETIKSVRNSFSGVGLVIDLHGQTHKQNSSELGYVWTIEELNNKDYTSPSSIKGLMQRRNLSPSEILFGPTSLGALLEAEGYKAIPSDRQKTPGKDKYYRGGYITQQYGSSNGGFIDAIQIEVPSEIRYEGGAELNTRYGKKLAKVLRQFFNTHYSPQEYKGLNRG